MCLISWPQSKLRDYFHTGKIAWSGASQRVELLLSSLGMISSWDEVWRISPKN